jgi:hypothetical protein
MQVGDWLISANRPRSKQPLRGGAHNGLHPKRRHDAGGAHSGREPRPSDDHAIPSGLAPRKSPGREVGEHIRHTVPAADLVPRPLPGPVARIVAAAGEAVAAQDNPSGLRSKPNRPDVEPSGLRSRPPRVADGDPNGLFSMPNGLSPIPIGLPPRRNPGLVVGEWLRYTAEAGLGARRRWVRWGCRYRWKDEPVPVLRALRLRRRPIIGVS